MSTEYRTQADGSICTVSPILKCRFSGKQLALREDGVKGVAIPGLSVHRPTDADGLLDFLQRGNSNRTQHPTDANAESSRSHAVFQVSKHRKIKPSNTGTLL